MYPTSRPVVTCKETTIGVDSPNILPAFVALAVLPLI